MIYIGIDIGSTASKVAVMGDKEMLFVLPTGWSSKETILTIKEKLMENDIDVSSENVKVVATGYGRVAVDFADHVITEITCHASVAERWLVMIVQSLMSVDRIQKLSLFRMVWSMIS